MGSEWESAYVRTAPAAASLAHVFSPVLRWFSAKPGHFPELHEQSPLSIKWVWHPVGESEAETGAFSPAKRACSHSAGFENQLWVPPEHLTCGVLVARLSPLLWPPPCSLPSPWVISVSGSDLFQ